MENCTIKLEEKKPLYIHSNANYLGRIISLLEKGIFEADFNV